MIRTGGLHDVTLGDGCLKAPSSGEKKFACGPFPSSYGTAYHTLVRTGTVRYRYGTGTVLHNVHHTYICPLPTHLCSCPHDGHNHELNSSHLFWASCTSDSSNSLTSRMISYNSRLLQETALDTACTGDALAENAALCELVSGNIVDTNCHTISLFFCSINVSPTLLPSAIYIGSKFLYSNGCTGSHRFSDRSRSKRVFRAFRGKKL